MSSSSTVGKTIAPASLLVYAAFFSTGVGLVLPGAILPLLLRHWAIGDARAGVLLFLFFVGSTLGAVASRGSLPRSFVRGAVITASGALALAFASRVSAFAAMPLYGLGLGIVMTSSSLMQSRRHAAERTAEMAKLNFLWAAGAVLVALSVLFAVFGVVGLAVPKDSVPPAKPTSLTAETDAPKDRQRALPLLLLLMLIPFSTGVESSTGGWLTTYTHRAGAGTDAMIGAVTCFWAGMLLSRLVQSQRLWAAWSRRLWFSGGPMLMTAALVLMIAAAQGHLVTLAALLLGIGVGPMYPLLLGLALDHAEAGNIAFVIAGCGASLLPLLTGLLSSAAGSLRAGLGVPLAGASLMLVLTLVARRLSLRAAG